MQTNRQPYELLLRWNSDGVLTGAHVQWRYVVTADNGEVLGETVSSPVPMAEGMSDGFPATSVLTQDALAMLG